MNNQLYFYRKGNAIQSRCCLNIILEVISLKKGSQYLWYSHPATAWVEALPIGNGSLGAMVFGGVETETLGLNLDTLWSGSCHGYKVENRVEHFKKARQLILEDKKIEARDYIEENFHGDPSEWYLQLGKLIITSMKNMCPRDYIRDLDLETGIATVGYNSSDTNYTRESFISFPDKVLVYRMTAEGKNKLDFKAMVDCELRYEVTTDGNTYFLDGIAPTHIEENGGNPICTYEDGERQGISFRCAFKIDTDGKVKANKNHLHVTDATYATIYLTAEDNFESWNKPVTQSQKDYKSICVSRLDNAVSKGFEEVKADHINDFSPYFNRVSIDLGESKKDNVPTDRRIHDFLHSRKNDNNLYCLLFNYGRYLTISASREGSQAMTLQGIWTFTMCSPWRSNYTVNINTEMNYWPTMMCSMPEMNMPLIKFIEEIAESGKETAKLFYGVDGTCCHHNVDLWRITTPSGGNPVWSFWPMAGAWFCRHLYEYYEYTLDKNYLEKTAVPIMEGNARFCLDMLIDDGNGYLILCPSTSPENEYMVSGKETSVSKTTYMTMEIVTDLFTNLLSAYDVLGIKNEISSRIEDALPRLLPFKQGKDGGLMEWYYDEKGFDKHHRHVSHLYALHPANLIDVERTPDLASYAKNTLKNRGDGGTGWSLGWKINFWARLRDKNKVIKLINNQLRYIPVKYKRGRGGTFPNMFDAHPPFQIDGNFGATAGIAQALMQSFGNRIIILPALPDEWANGHIYGLTAKGGVKVDIEWANGKLTKLTLDGSGEFEIVYNGQSRLVSLDGKKDVDF